MGKAKRLKTLRRVAEQLTVGRQARGFIGVRQTKKDGTFTAGAAVPADTTRGLYKRMKDGKR